MKKLLLVFCVLLGLTGCGQVLDESFDKETLKQETIAIVENLNDENYDAIVTTVNGDLKDILSAQFHDMLPGTSVLPVEKAGMRMLDHALEILSRIKEKAFLSNIRFPPSVPD